MLLNNYTNNNYCFIAKKQQQQEAKLLTDVNTRLEAKISSMGLEISRLKSMNQGLSECMVDTNVKLNDKDQEIQRLGQALLLDTATTTTQSKQEMEALLGEKDSEIKSLKAQLQANGIPAAGRVVVVVPRTRVTAAQVIFADVVFFFYHCYHHNMLFFISQPVKPPSLVVVSQEPPKGMWMFVYDGSNGKIIEHGTFVNYSKIKVDECYSITTAAIDAAQNANTYTFVHLVNRQRVTAINKFTKFCSNDIGINEGKPWVVDGFLSNLDLRQHPGFIAMAQQYRSGGSSQTPSFNSWVSDPRLRVGGILARFCISNVA